MRSKTITTLLLLLSSCFVKAQFLAPSPFNGESKYNYRVFVDRPTLASDSAAIIKKEISRIKVYENRAKDDGTWSRSIFAIWVIDQKDGKIASFTLNGKYETLLRENTELTLGKGKLTETIGYSGLKFKMTHLQDSTGQVLMTERKCIQCKYESRYDAFIRIEYHYTDGLPSEALYFCDETFCDKDRNYLKYTFEYEE